MLVRLSPITPGNTLASVGKTGGGSLEFKRAAAFTLGAEILPTFRLGRTTGGGWTSTLGTLGALGASTAGRIGAGCASGVSATEFLAEVLATGSKEFALPGAFTIGACDTEVTGSPVMEGGAEVGVAGEFESCGATIMSR